VCFEKESDISIPVVKFLLRKSPNDM
jgi:hypothetical protein